MPTARELLEQADALMRKNRGHADTDIPLLTDSVAATPSVIRAPPSEIPVLTDRVEEVVVDLKPLPEPARVVEPLLEGDPSDWLVMDTIDPAMHSVTGRAPDTLAVVPPVTLKAPESKPEDVEAGPPSVTLKAAGSAPTPPPAGSGAPVPHAPLLAAIAAAEVPAAVSAPETEAARAEHGPASEDERWRALAEQISMQVLQRIDLFTDTGLKEQLANHLQPIVERASAELVSAINEHVGKLVRSYIAEAIEREIAQWRRDNR